MTYKQEIIGPYMVSCEAMKRGRKGKGRCRVNCDEGGGDCFVYARRADMLETGIWIG